MANNGKIFVAEDNPTNLKLVKDILSFQGFEVLEAMDGKAALAGIMEKKDEISLILMDIQLPEIDGLEVIRQIKADDTVKNIPVWVVSAHAMEHDIEKAKLAGADSFISKPLNLQEFISKIKTFFNI